MGVLNNSMWNVSGDSDFYEHQIANSARIPATSSTSSSNGRLTRTVGTVDSNVHFTLNFWIKRNAIGGTNPVGSARLLNLFTPRSGTSGSTLHEFGFSATGSYGAGDAFVITNTNTGAYVLSTNNLFRDTSAWYNIHIMADLDNGTAGEKLKIFVNGTEASYNVDNRSNFSAFAGMVAGAWTIGDYYNYGYPIQSYLAQFTFIDGTTYAASDFGETKNGVWIPKDPSGLTFGSEGYLLNFEASGDLGNDSSGNNNDWTSVNMAAHDQMGDTPTFNSSANGGNFATIGPLWKTSDMTFSEGNLKWTTSTNQRGAMSNWSIPLEGKYYFEYVPLSWGASSGDDMWIGLNVSTVDFTASRGGKATCYGYGANSGKKIDGDNTEDSYGASWGTDDIIGVAVDRVNDTIQFSKNGSFQGSAFAIPATADLFPWVGSGGGSNSASGVFNFGADGTFAGNVTAGGNADDTGYGNFKYAPPSGFLSLCSGNLPTPLADPAEDEQPSKFFSPYIWTGNGQNRNITIAADKKPSMTWIKERGATNSWNVWQHGYSDFDGDPDSFLETNSTGLVNANQGANGTFTAAPSATALPLTVYGQVNANTDTYVGYVWSMNGGSNSTNSNGSVDSEVDANATRGQSLVTYTGTNNSWGNAITVGHGLDAAPDFIIAKQMTGNADEWAVFHSAVGAGGGTTAAHNSLVLSSAAALYTNQSYKGFGGTMPTTTVFTVDGNNQNRSGSKIVAMCFTSKEGYSKFSSFEGNGNADGTFVYTGFRPSMIWAKSIDSTSDWFVFDNKRVGYNDDNNALSINSNAAETTTDMVDILSNGFKFRIATDPNVAETYIYCAWADVPFKYATAR